MADKQVRIDIVANDDASEQIADVAADVKKLDQLEPEVAVTADTAAAKSALVDITDTLNKIDAEKATAEVDTTGATDNVKRLGSESDNTKSVMANMVGNTAQDFGALGGVAGTAGMAVGQLGEYAAEGTIAWKAWPSMAGPMAGLAIAGMAVNAVMKIFARPRQTGRGGHESVA